MEQKIENGDFKETSIDWDSSEGETPYEPYKITSTTIAPMVYTKPKWLVRLFGRVKKTMLNGLIHKSLIKDGVIYLWTNKKPKNIRHAYIVGDYTGISDEDALIMIEGENNGK